MKIVGGIGFILQIAGTSFLIEAQVIEGNVLESVQVDDIASFNMCTQDLAVKKKRRILQVNTLVC